VRIGNAGKDVIWVPTHDKLVTAMLEAAGTGPDDVVIDLGAGDGKIPIAAAKEFGAKAVGIEYDARMVELAQCYVRAEQLTQRVEIRQADIFQEDFSKATVLTMYLLPALNRKLRPSLLELEPGTRIVSNRFKLGRWQPDKLIDVEGVANQAYLWIVPARIEGVWRFEQQTGTESFRARLQQEFQLVRGNVLGNSRAAIRGKLRGTHIELRIALRGSTTRFEGTVEASRITLRSTQDNDSRIFIGRPE
jgi:Methyltransferase domain